MPFTVTLPSGVEWTPKFVQSIDQEKCIGCGRCYKVCSRQVMQLRGVDADGEFVWLDPDDDDDEYEKKVMALAQPDKCIGCEACSMACPKKCYSHAAA